MSLNNILLDAHLLTGLYKNVLVETKAATSVPETKSLKTENQPLKYLGKNARKILLAVSHTNTPIIPDTELAFLTNILSACRLSLADVAVFNINGLDHEAIDNAVKELQGQQVLLFGIDPLSFGLPLNFPQYQLQQFNQRTYLYSPGLDALEQDKNLKAKLWNCLKTLFQL